MGGPSSTVSMLVAVVVIAMTCAPFARAASTAGAPPSNTAAGSSAGSAAPILDHGYLKVGFDQLAGYTFTPPQFDPVAAANGNPPSGEEQIPATVKALSGKKVVVTGYMVPVKIDKGLATEFLLMRNTMACCFGGVPNMNEWVVVKMRQGVQPVMDIPLPFYGNLKVGAIFENGYMTGLYQLDGEKMGEAQ